MTIVTSQRLARRSPLRCGGNPILALWLRVSIASDQCVLAGSPTGVTEGDTAASGGALPPPTKRPNADQINRARSSINVNKAGTNSNDSRVEVTRPLMTAIAIGE